MTYDEKYLFELPDYILGKSTPEVSKEIEEIISKDPTFKNEYESLKSTLNDLQFPLDAAFEKPQPIYFATFSTRLNQHIHFSKQSIFDKISSQLSSIFTSSSQPKLVGGLLSLFGIVVLIITMFNSEVLIDVSKEKQSMLEAEHHLKAIQFFRDETELATIHYALGSGFYLADLNEEQSDYFIDIINEEFPTQSSDYKILSEEDIHKLMN